MTINPSKLYAELAAAGLPVCSTRQGDPPADYTRPLTTAEKATAAQIILAHDPTPTPPPLEAFAARGITPEQMLCALWQKVVQNDATLADQIAGLG